MDATKDAQQLDAEGKCVACKKPARNRRRGLCVADYNKFVRALSQVPEEYREQFEQRLIDRGLLLPSRQGQRSGKDNVFSNELRSFLAETYRETQGSRSSADAEALADQLVADAEGVQEKARRSTPKKRRKRSGAKKS